jgi:hypothetical protein
MLRILVRTFILIERTDLGPSSNTQFNSTISDDFCRAFRDYSGIPADIRPGRLCGTLNAVIILSPLSDLPIFLSRNNDFLKQGYQDTLFVRNHEELHHRAKYKGIEFPREFNSNYSTPFCFFVECGGIIKCVNSFGCKFGEFLNHFNVKTSCDWIEIRFFFMYNRTFLVPHASYDHRSVVYGLKEFVWSSVDDFGIIPRIQ